MFLEAEVLSDPSCLLTLLTEDPDDQQNFRSFWVTEFRADFNPALMAITIGTAAPFANMILTCGLGYRTHEKGGAGRSRTISLQRLPT